MLFLALVAGQREKCKDMQVNMDENMGDVKDSSTFGDTLRNVATSGVVSLHVRYKP